MLQELHELKENIKSQKKELDCKELQVNEMNEKLDLMTAKISMMDEKDKQVIELLDKCEKSCADYEFKSAELAKLQQDAKEIQHESVKLKKILQVKEAALEEKESDVSSLKAELDSKEEAIQHFILQYGNLEQKNAKLEQDLDVHSKSNDSSLLKEMEKLKERNLLLEEQLHEMLEEQEKFENSSSQMSALKLQEELANQALDVVQTDLYESKEEIKRLLNLLNDSKSNQELLQKKMAYYEEKLDKYEHQLETADGIVASSNSTNKNVQKLMEDLAASEGHNKVLEEELLRVVKELQTKLDQVPQVPEKDSSFNENDGSVKAELEEKIKQLTILEHEHKSLGNLFSILKSELDAKDSDSKKLQKNLDLAMKELDEEKNIVISMKKEFKEIESLKNNSKSDQKEIQELASTLSIISEKNSQLEGVIKKLENELAQLHKQEKSNDSALEALEKEIETQVASLKRRDHEANELKEKLTREKQENESLTDFIKQADVPSLLTRVGYLEKLASEYESKVTKTMNDKTTIESRLKDSEAIILKLQDEISSQGGNAIQAPQVLIEKQQKIEELTRFNESLFKKIETLTKMLEAADSAKPVTPIDNPGVESIILASRKQAEDAESAIQALTTEVSRAYEKINALLGEKADLEDEILKLKQS